MGPKKILFLVLWINKKMSLVDCSGKEGFRCGRLGVFANLSSVPVGLEIQYPGNDHVWYALGAFRGGDMFQAGPASISFPGDSILRANAGDRQYYLGKIIEGEENLFYLPQSF